MSVRISRLNEDNDELLSDFFFHIFDYDVSWYDYIIIPGMTLNQI